MFHVPNMKLTKKMLSVTRNHVATDVLSSTLGVIGKVFEGAPNRETLIYVAGMMAGGIHALCTLHDISEEELAIGIASFANDLAGQPNLQ